MPTAECECHLEEQIVSVRHLKSGRQGCCEMSTEPKPKQLESTAVRCYLQIILRRLQMSHAAVDSKGGSNGIDSIDDKEQMVQGWLQEIFNGVKNLPCLKTPGRLFTYGDEAFPVILGSSDSDQMMALVNYGTGRVAAIACHNYVSTFGTGKEKDAGVAQLHENLKRWLTKGTCHDDTCICAPTNSDELNACIKDKSISIIAWSGGDWPTSKENDRVDSWVSNKGGALLHGFTSGAWPEEGGKSSITMLGFYKTVWKSGIVYTPNSFSSSGKNLDVSDDADTASK